jgi:FAD/FMN-containing dehydrogenase
MIDLPLARLASDLTRQVPGGVRFDPGSRATYSTDASNYRAVPLGVVLPRTPEDAVAAIAVCSEHDMPVLSRGGGTSLAGQCCNAAVVLDWSKYCDRLISVDADARTAVVEPGITLDPLNAQLSRYDLMVGPEPATHVSCTIGGMIGNNSCGSTAQADGKMVDSVRRLEIPTYDGLRVWVGANPEADGDRFAELFDGLRRIRDDYAADIRAHYPDIPRRVSGYNLDALLPEHDFDIAKLVVGSESTLVTVLRAELELVPRPKAVALSVLGYPDIYDAADAVPMVLRHKPIALEGLDHRLVELEHVEHLAEGATARLPDGNGWLMAQFEGADQALPNARAS